MARQATPDLLGDPIPSEDPSLATMFGTIIESPVSDASKPLQSHPVADIFPMMSAAEFDALKADIAANGLLEAVWLHPDGRILDGRNRYRACCDLGITPHFRAYAGRLDTSYLVQFVLSLNLKRRHLDSGQRAFVALEVERVLAEAARERMVAGGIARQQGSQKIDYPQESIGKAAAQAAAIVGTNRQYVSDAKRIQEQAPDLAKQVKNGDMKIVEARRQLNRRVIAMTPIMPSSKFRVLYADPPWSYGNTQPDYHPEQRDHYPVMSMATICALPIKDIAEDNAVLFLWVTSPILEEAFQVIKAWGFQYKASFVWDKIKHNMGHYNSVRHEFLLVCVKGSCQPDILRLFDSVQSIERTEHSVKPDEFRHIIETLYPHGRRIELFARRQAPGWEVYGNEC